MWTMSRGSLLALIFACSCLPTTPTQDQVGATDQGPAGQGGCCQEGPGRGAEGDGGGGGGPRTIAPRIELALMKSIMKCTMKSTSLYTYICVAE